MHCAIKLKKAICLGSAFFTYNSRTTQLGPYIGVAYVTTNTM